MFYKNLMYKQLFKRWIDFIFAILLLILISPIFFITLIILSVYYRGNPFFSQRRPGINEQPFRLLKFKSMIEKYDRHRVLLPDAKRVTPLGKFLRKTSLDEMPQLLNVIKGDMSFIGPRPLLVSYLPFYSKREKLRHNVRPGITGLAQVSGRNNLKLPERLEMDVQYVDNISFINDFKIGLKTIKNVLGGKDITIITASKTLQDYREEEESLNPN